MKSNNAKKDRNILSFIQNYKQTLNRLRKNCSSNARHSLSKITPLHFFFKKKLCIATKKNNKSGILQKAFHNLGNNFDPYNSSVDKTQIIKNLLKFNSLNIHYLRMKKLDSILETKNYSDIFERKNIDRLLKTQTDLHSGIDSKGTRKSQAFKKELCSPNNNPEQFPQKNKYYSMNMKDFYFANSNGDNSKMKLNQNYIINKNNYNINPNSPILDINEDKMRLEF